MLLFIFCVEQIVLDAWTRRREDEWDKMCLRSWNVDTLRRYLSPSQEPLTVDARDLQAMSVTVSDSGFVKQALLTLLQGHTTFLHRLPKGGGRDLLQFLRRATPARPCGKCGSRWPSFRCGGRWAAGSPWRCHWFGDERHNAFHQIGHSCVNTISPAYQRHESCLTIAESQSRTAIDTYLNRSR